MMLSQRDQKMRELYFAGWSRQSTMEKLGITNTNTMSSISARLGLYWKLPTDQRKLGIRPPKRRAESVVPATRATNMKQARKPGWEQYDGLQIPKEKFDELAARIEPVQLKRPRVPFHLSRAFPTSEESGLTMREHFGVSLLYTWDFNEKKAFAYV